MKRFKKTKKGKIRRNRAYAGHLKTKKSSKKKREIRKGVLLNKGDAKRVRRLMPYS
jgi:large subunit ribosomal protein L35